MSGNADLSQPGSDIYSVESDSIPLSVPHHFPTWNDLSDVLGNPGSEID